MEENYLLEALNVTKKFPGVIANNDVTLKVVKGEIFGIIGENGSGKSTFLGLLNGVHPYGSYEGEIYFKGALLKNDSPNDALKAGIGFVPQEINVLPDLTVAENIFMSKLDNFGANGFLSMKNLFRQAQGLLDNYKIKLKAKDFAKMLSIGQQQLLMIARALATNPDLLILDEPTTSLTINDVENLFTIMREMKSKGVTQILVSHKLDEMIEITDMIAVLRDGVNAASYERVDFKKEDIVESMVGRKIEQMYPKRYTEIGGEILRVENLTVDHPKIYGRYLAKDVNFELKKGEVLGFAGLVGAGRSETLRAVYGAIKKRSGDVYIEGRKVKIRNEKDAIKNGLSFVTEDRKYDGLLFEGNIASNIVINNLKAVENYGFVVTPKSVARRIVRFFEMFKIKAASIYDSIFSLSGGNQQKVVLSRAMNSDPKILLLDEPTKGIDVGSKNDIYNIINDLVASGVSIIMVSSELPELLAMCDRFIVMGDGVVKGELPKEDANSMSVMMLATT